MTAPVPPTPPKIAWGRNSALFASELSKGFKYQRMVADFLLCHSIDVQMPRMRVRKSIASAGQFTDEPDMLANGAVIEVKSRNLSFQRSMDLPSTVLLDTCNGHDAKKTKPLAFVMVSQETGCMLWTPGTDTKGHWAVVNVHDKKRDTRYRAYVARRFDFEPMGSLVAALQALPPSEVQ